MPTTTMNPVSLFAGAMGPASEHASVEGKQPSSCQVVPTGSARPPSGKSHASHLDTKGTQPTSQLGGSPRT